MSDDDYFEETQDGVRQEIKELELRPAVVKAMAEARAAMFYRWEGIFVEFNMDEPEMATFIAEVAEHITIDGFTKWQAGDPVEDDL